MEIIKSLHSIFHKTGRKKNEVYKLNFKLEAAMRNRNFKRQSEGIEMANELVSQGKYNSSLIKTKNRGGESTTNIGRYKVLIVNSSYFTQERMHGY